MIERVSTPKGIKQIISFWRNVCSLYWDMVSTNYHSSLRARRLKLPHLLYLDKEPTCGDNEMIVLVRWQSCFMCQEMLSTECIWPPSPVRPKRHYMQILYLNVLNSNTILKIYCYYNGIKNKKITLIVWSKFDKRRFYLLKTWDELENESCRCWKDISSCEVLLIICKW